ncbi:hypothetical protein ZIOFF_006335 [Zingiber officinale]|uniref:RMT2 domain-containing protein n=1 Tax=Zingiber officinale TaxID=94328 RepID=A0A8J5IE51_ZINOF|nr:hypothetical protein ZIOFF_006335 [Zingiber officinale]
MSLGNQLVAKCFQNFKLSKLKNIIQNQVLPKYFKNLSLTKLNHAKVLGGNPRWKVLVSRTRIALASGASGASRSQLSRDAGGASEVRLDQKLRDFKILSTPGVDENMNFHMTLAKGVSELEPEDDVTVKFEKLNLNKKKVVQAVWFKPLTTMLRFAVCNFKWRVLNVGFGMGLVDEAIQRYGPVEHTIVEAHPDVYDRMLRCGWGEKENVKIVFGRWQDVLPQLESYDENLPRTLILKFKLTCIEMILIHHAHSAGIFFDTYGEYYEDLRQFHQHLPKLLKPDGIYSYFNGLCGDNAFFHVVYCQLVALELGNLGYSTQFIPLPVKDCLAEEVWEGVRRKYWQLDTYYLPVCQPSGDSE